MAAENRITMVVVLLASFASCWAAEGASTLDLGPVREMAKSQEGLIHSFHIKQVITEESARAISVPEEALKVDPFLGVLQRVNRDLKEEQEVWCDFQVGRWRILTTDLRDLKALAKDFTIPHTQFPRLSRSTTVLGGTKDYLVQFYRDEVPPLLAIVPTLDKLQPGVKRYWPQLDLALGVVPSKHLVPSGTTVALRLLEQKPETPDLIIPGGSEVPQIIYHIDPTIQYRYREVEYPSVGGTASRRQKLSDFRQTGQVLCPFRMEDETRNADGTLLKRRVVLLKDAAFNTFVAPAELKLSLPAGIRVSEFVRTKGHESFCPKPFEVDLDNVFDAVSLAGSATTRPN